MKYLLDTQAWIWSVLDHPRLSRRARIALNTVSAQERIGLAAISLKEAAWHLAHGRIAVNEDFGPRTLWLRKAASSPHLEVLPLTVDVAIESEQLGRSFPPDPADCLIAATARVYDLRSSPSTRLSARAALSEPSGRCRDSLRPIVGHCSGRRDTRRRIAH